MFQGSIRNCVFKNETVQQNTDQIVAILEDETIKHKAHISEIEIESRYIVLPKECVCKNVQMEKVNVINDH